MTLLPASKAVCTVQGPLGHGAADFPGVRAVKNCALRLQMSCRLSRVLQLQVHGCTWASAPCTGALLATGTSAMCCSDLPSLNSSELIRQAYRCAPLYSIPAKLSLRIHSSAGPHIVLSPTPSPASAHRGAAPSTSVVDTLFDGRGVLRSSAGPLPAPSEPRCM